MGKKEAYQINVSGIVQGVGFRYFTKQKADQIGVSGTVQNLSDGSVEIYVEGTKSAVHAFLSWCHQGPPSATVEKLEYVSANVLKVNQFRIIR